MYFVKLKNLSLEFPIYGTGPARSLKKRLLNTFTGGAISTDSKERFNVKALDNISLSIKEGDRVGIFGHNGAGKSTLLRIIAGVYEPTQGSIKIKGKIMSMLSITLGIDPEASGYENIYLRGRVMGYSLQQIDKVFDDIVNFSGIGNYLALPIRTYSSGMLMRLAFSISTAMPSDIILMDEWLSVGDDDFTKKANKRIKNFIEQSKIFFIASHNKKLLSSVCNKIIRLDRGKISSIEH